MPEPDRENVSLRVTLHSGDNAHLASVCGCLDEHLRAIERDLSVRILNRGPIFSIEGASANAERARGVLENLDRRAGQGELLTLDGVRAALGTADDARSSTEGVTLRIPKLSFTVKTPNQRQYITEILGHDVTFGVGPAGTGKTFLAVACAVDALERDRVRRIVLVRPAVEAGERLGFLPGGLGQKVDPYLRPLYDALNDMLGSERVARLLERNIIELAPLAYMRGRTLTDSFVILDEAQNTSIEQMKMFLTRLGSGTKIVVTGDITQTDLPRGQVSGLRHALGILQQVPGLGFVHFGVADVVRHPLVQRIIDAYARPESAAP
ncbi:MAG TPA: PhoH family protein [Acidiferrobacteraceae bacterium]|nr:PhoH family protein [Acidiferrobacteraceae bacterium]